MKPAKLFRRIQASKANVTFADFARLVEAFGFVLDRHSGTSHRIYKHRTQPEARLNLQSVQGEAKPYQIAQFLKLVEAYDLRIEDQSDPA